MKYLFILLVGLFCSFAAPPGAFATTHAPAVRAAIIYKRIQVVQAAVATTATEEQAARMAPAESAVPLVSAEVMTNAEGSGATTTVYLAILGTVLHARPGWRGSVGSAYTEHKAAGLRYS